LNRRRRTLASLALAGLAALAFAIGAVTYVVYTEISAEIVGNTEEILHGRFQSADQIITTVIQDAVHSAGILLATMSSSDGNRNQFAHGLAQLISNVPATRHVWALPENGEPVFGPLTDRAYLERNSWWRGYVAPRPATSLTVSSISDTASVIGQPFRDALNLDTILPIVIYRFRGVDVTSTVFIESDLTLLLEMYTRDFSTILGSTGSRVDMSVYGRDGILLETTANLPLFHVQPLSPAQKLQLSPAQIDTLHSSGRLAVLTPEYLRLYGVDAGTGLIFDSRIQRTVITRGVTRITLRILGIGLLSLAGVLVLGLLLVRALLRMRLFEEQSAQARLETLQAKMNPHFLFNTLDSMVGVVTRNDRDTLLRMLRSLSYMLHMTVRKQEDIVTLQEELRYVESYIELQRVRYGDEFSYDLSMDENLLDLCLNRFCIQPLVENCFVHGLGELHGGTMNIRVAISRQADTLLVSVVDDGPGCSPDVSRRLARIFSDDHNLNDNRIGLTAVHRRLRSMYGRRFGLTLLELDRGFGVEVRLPIVQMPI
jgi:hypothetical protein